MPSSRVTKRFDISQMFLHFISHASDAVRTIRGFYPETRQAI
jgi:hypothetical protein